MLCLLPEVLPWSGRCKLFTTFHHRQAMQSHLWNDRILQDTSVINDGVAGCSIRLCYLFRAWDINCPLHDLQTNLKCRNVAVTIFCKAVLDEVDLCCNAAEIHPKTATEIMRAMIGHINRLEKCGRHDAEEVHEPCRSICNSTMAKETAEAGTTVFQVKSTCTNLHPCHLINKTVKPSTIPKL